MNNKLLFLFVLILLSVSSKAMDDSRRIVLNKNQDFAKQVNKENTTYVIQDVFDLNDIDNKAPVKIPNNCLLKFDGGCLKNGTVVGANTRIEAGLVKIFDNDLTLKGTWDVVEAYPEWFSNDLKKTVDNFQCVKLTGTEYITHEVVEMKCGSRIISDKLSCILFYTDNADYSLKMGYSSKLYGLKLFFSASSGGVLIDDEYLRLTRKENKFNIIKGASLSKSDYDVAQTYDRTYIDNCHFSVIAETTNGLFSGKTALRITSRGAKKDRSNSSGYSYDIKDTGIYGIVFSNITFYGEWYRNIDIDASTDSDAYNVGGWLTDLTFENIFFGCAYNNIWIHKDDKHSSRLVENFNSPICLTFINCNVQHTTRYNKSGAAVAQQSYFCKIDAGHDIKFIGCEIWDWNDESTIPLPPFYIDPRYVWGVDLQLGIQHDRNKWVDYPKLKDLEYSTAKCYATPYSIRFTDNSRFTAILEKVLQEPEGNGNRLYQVDLALIPDGLYRVGSGITLLKYLNLAECTGSTSIQDAWLEKVTTNSSRRIKLTVEYRDNSTGALRTIRLTQTPGSLVDGKWIYQGVNWIWFHDDQWFLGSGGIRPKGGVKYGQMFYDTTIKKMLYWYNKWVDENGFTAAPSKGTTKNRPTSILGSSDSGYEYFDTDLGKPIYFVYKNGTKTWVDAMGVPIK